MRAIVADGRLRVKNMQSKLFHTLPLSKPLVFQRLLTPVQPLDCLRKGFSSTPSGFNGCDVLEDHEAEATRLARVLVHHDLTEAFKRAMSRPLRGLNMIKR